MTEEDIREFWNNHPCGDRQVGGLHDDYEEFFARYDEFRYSREPHILAGLNAINFAGKCVLEIGLGQGADSERIIRKGAVWSGIDLTPESVERVEMRLRLRNLAYERLSCASVLSLPFNDQQFDIVFSHGVLHHVPEIVKAQGEIRRVLKPGGRLIVMLYARRSLNYLLAIKFVRRAGLAACYSLGLSPRGIIGDHLNNARKIGLLNYLRMSNFVHRNTDGPLNPYSKVYDVATVRQDFPDFVIEKSYQTWMHAPPLPVAWLRPLARYLGWHLWVYLIPR